MRAWAVSWRGFSAMVVKEFIQMRRDRVTFAMMLGIPIMQLLVFGSAINSDPKRLPAAVVAQDSGPVTRAVVGALQNTGYFKITETVFTPEDATTLLQQGRVQFAIIIPENFERAYVRGERPQILIEADASDPAATVNALAAGAQVDQFVLGAAATGVFLNDAGKRPGFEIVIHRRYNPENKTYYNIVPGLIGVILTQTMVVITSIAVTRERERGTLETLLVMPLRPLEVMLGKIVPYVFIGYVQLAIILLAAHFIFGVPVVGSVLLLSLLTIVFIATNLAIGFLFSTAAKTQLEAVQMSFFFFLPSILLSGFMFPYHGMPQWAQWIGAILPLTHYLRIVRGIVLKGAGFADLMGDFWPLLLILTVIATVAMIRYRQTLD